jgi:phosphoadenosine phosphosulfate reductase
VSPQEILRDAYATHQRVALVASFQIESVVLIDMAAQVVGEPEVLTIDTGRLPQATFDAIDAVLERYPIRLRVLAPDPQDLALLAAEHGTNPFLRSVELRRHCCDIRKTRPLSAALAGYDAWITGLRRDQGATRAGTPITAPDPAHGGIAKIAPLAEWTRDQVWAYARERALPLHPLYGKGYTSIGCAPCTRATQPGDDERAGRWWWERDGVKECGLHHSEAKP